MKEVTLHAYAKINLTLDVLGKRPNGYHDVSMIMQQVSLCDTISVRWMAESARQEIGIRLEVDNPQLPAESTNLAWKAAEAMIDGFKQQTGGIIYISIRKNIPMAAGLAGGSSNCAAVLHAINQLWHLELSVKELCAIGAQLGSDVPFCIMGQAAAEDALRETFKDDPDACHCALATGTGTELEPLTGLDSWLVLSKPAIGVSTAEAYDGIDKEGIPVHPDNISVIRAVRENSYKVLERKMVNVLENFTLKRYPIIVYTKNTMSDLCQSAGIPPCVMMSGSGPTVFCLCENETDARRICETMLEQNPESFVAHTTS